MRRIVLLAVGVLAGTPAFAAGLHYQHPDGDSPFYAPTSMVVGDLGISGGLTAASGTTAHGISGTGRVSVPFVGTHRFELELSGGYLSSHSSATSAFDAIGHLYKASPTYAIGAYAGVLGVMSSEVYMLGIEGNSYMGATTLNGELGIIGRTTGSHGTIFLARGGFSYYFTPNKKLMTKLTYLNGNGTSIWGASAGIEHRFVGTPWSIYALASYASSSGSGSSGSAWTGTIGARVFFDDPRATLQQHDKAVPFSAGISALDFL